MQPGEVTPTGFSGRFKPHPAGQSADDGRVWHHGEIHNADELCRDLGVQPSEPLGRLLLAGWRRWGDQLWRRLDGSFALAIQDRNRLVLYRDPSGLCNLYLDGAGRGEVAFGTELEALVGAPGARRPFARAVVHEYLRFGDIAAPRTIYEGVIAVQPGWQLAWSASGLETSPAPAGVDGAAASPGDFDGAVDRLEALLDAAVRRRVAGIERPAAFLSGGIDSALVCALARRHRPDLTALTVGFEGAALDETPTARLIAQHLDLQHDVLRFGRREGLSALMRLHAGAQQPFADPAATSTLLAFDHCRGRYGTVLDGSGADEAVGMMPPRHARVAVGTASLLPRPLRRTIAAALRSWSPLAPYARIVAFEHPAEPMIRWRGFTRLEVEALCGEPVSFADTHFYRTFDRFPRRAHFERYSALLDAMPADRLNEAMRLSGQPARYPYCEPATDRYLRQLPVDYRHRPGEPKRILRALLARHVPTPIWDGPKHGFDFPLHSFLAGDDHDLVKRHLLAAEDGFAGLVSPAAARQLAARFIGGDASLTFRVWLLVLLAAWLQHREGPM